MKNIKKKNFAYFKYLIIYTFMENVQVVGNDYISIINFMKFSTIYALTNRSQKKKLIEIFVDIIRIIYPFLKNKFCLYFIIYYEHFMIFYLIHGLFIYGRHGRSCQICKENVLKQFKSRLI